MHYIIFVQAYISVLSKLGKAMIYLQKLSEFISLLDNKRPFRKVCLPRNSLLNATLAVLLLLVRQITTKFYFLLVCFPTIDVNNCIDINVVSIAAILH